MHEPSYRLVRIKNKKPTGITAASSCTLNAILKFDSPESPHCVYNEHVALRLAQTLHIPVADGVLTSTGDGPAYASLEVATPGIPLPDILETQIERAAATYPDAVAALVAFDILIGNWDRGRNIKTALVTTHIKLFRAFDHSHALLNIEAEPEASLLALNSEDLIVKFHPFYGHVSMDHLVKWVTRIASLPDEYVEECCRFGKPFRAVAESIQEQLAQALNARKLRIEEIISSNVDSILAP